MEESWHANRMTGKVFQEAVEAHVKASVWDRVVHRATEMEGGWLSRLLWEASCGSLVCILCVTSYLTLLQVMRLLKHKLAI